MTENQNVEWKENWRDEYISTLETQKTAAAIRLPIKSQNTED